MAPEVSGSLVALGRGARCSSRRLGAAPSLQLSSSRASLLSPPHTSPHSGVAAGAAHVPKISGSEAGASSVSGSVADAAAYPQALQADSAPPATPSAPPLPPLPPSHLEYQVQCRYRVWQLALPLLLPRANVPSPPPLPRRLTVATRHSTVLPPPPPPQSSPPQPLAAHRCRSRWLVRQRVLLLERWVSGCMEPRLPPPPSRSPASPVSLPPLPPPPPSPPSPLAARRRPGCN